MSAEALLAILGMALATFATRAGGIWLGGLVPTTGFAGRWLQQIPGAVLTALVAPALLQGSWHEIAAATVAAAAQRMGGQPVVSMAVGIAVVALLRAA